MVTDISKLIDLCDEELINRGYSIPHHEIIRTEWDQLKRWMDGNCYTNFSESMGLMYCDETFGAHILTDQLNEKKKRGLRATRMLISFQKRGEFEFRTPRVERVFAGDIGGIMQSYLHHGKYTLSLSIETIRNKEQYLYDFYKYLNSNSYSLNDLSTAVIESFFTSMGYSLSSRHVSASTLRIFLRFVYDKSLTSKDYSLYILPDNYKKHNKIPTTYNEAEIRNIISAVERSSAIGKRDYLILLLAAEYGWRTKDIVRFRFNQIDWDKNVIRFNQSKTEVPVEYPLLSSIGNAIIDYLKNGRPKTNAEEIIVSAESSKKGQPLSSPTIHSIVSRYMSKANIKNWKQKKHGAHSLRHSLATNMLKKNISMPIISTVLGHQSTQSTKIYLSVDIKNLRECALPIPELFSAHYGKEV